MVRTNIVDWLSTIVDNRIDLDVIRSSEIRIRNAYDQILSGYKIKPESLVKIVSEEYAGNACVEQTGIPFYSICAHHFLPFFGTIDISYRPEAKLIGIGKLPRLVECFANRLTMQETIVKSIGDFLIEAVDAKAVEIRSTARHLCVEARGPRALGSTTSCSYSKTR